MIDKRFHWMLPAAVAAGIFCWGWAGQAAESSSGSGGRIEFSELDLPQGLTPGFGELQDRRGNRFQPVQRGSSMGGVVEGLPSMPSGTALPAGDARMRDMLDRRRNWIHATEPDMGAGLTAEEALGVRGYGQNFGRLTTGRGDLDGFGQGDSRGQPGLETRNPLFDTSPDSLSLDVYPLDRLGGADSLGLWAPQSVMRGTRASEAGGTFGGTVGILPIAPSISGTDTGTGSETGARSRHGTGVAPGTIGDLFATPDGMNLWGLDSDPIQFRVDTTRQELNPSAPQRRLDLASPRSSGELAVGGLERRSPRGGSMMGLVESLAPDGQETGSLTPVMRAVPEPQGVRPVLRFGEFPSRSF